MAEYGEKYSPESSAQDVIYSNRTVEYATRRLANLNENVKLMTNWGTDLHPVSDWSVSIIHDLVALKIITPPVKLDGVWYVRLG